MRIKCEASEYRLFARLSATREKAIDPQTQPTLKAISLGMKKKEREPSIYRLSINAHKVQSLGIQTISAV